MLPLFGCSVVKSGLVGEERENVVPFAEQTISSIALERIDFRESEFVYLSAISDIEGEEVAELRRLLAMADEFRDEIVYYSVELVHIAEMNATEPERVNAYADALLSLGTHVALQLELTDAERAGIVATIREQEDFLAALRAAQPLVIDRAAGNFEDLLREIEEKALVSAVDYLYQLIEDDFAVFEAHTRIMLQRRDDMLSALNLVHDIRLGDATAVDELRSLSIMAGRELTIPDSPGDAKLTEVEAFILAQMSRDNAIGEYTSVDIDTYLNAHAELEREEREVLDGLNLARLQVAAWSRSHQSMANGAKEPGKWLELVTEAASAAARQANR